MFSQEEAEEKKLQQAGGGRREAQRTSLSNFCGRPLLIAGGVVTNHHNHRPFALINKATPAYLLVARLLYRSCGDL